MQFINARSSLCLILALSLTGCGGDATTSTSATPEDTFKAFQTDFKAGDYEKAVGHFTQASQKKIAGALAVGAGFAMLFSKDSDGLQAIMKAHGMDSEDDSDETINLNSPEEAFTKLGEKIKNRRKFIAAVVGWFEKEGKQGGNSKLTELTAAVLKNVKVDGESATATIVMSGESEPIEFRKEGAAWKLHITTKMLSGGSTNSNTADMTFDNDSNFDFGTNGNSGFEGFGNNFEKSDDLPASEPISLQDYEASWKLTGPVAGSTVGEIINAMAKKCDLEVTGLADFSEQLATPFTIVDAANRSALQIIEEASNAAGLYPVYKLRTMTLKKGQRVLPVAFHGPFLLEVAGLITNAPNPTGRLTLKCIAAGLPTTVVARVNEISGFGSDDRFDLKPTSITANGNDLGRPKDDNVVFFGSPKFTKTGFQVDSTVDLLKLLRSVESIDSIKGAIEFSLVAEVETGKFAKQGDEVVNGKQKLTLKKWGKEVSIEFKGYKSKDVNIVGRDKDGNRMQTSGAGSFSFGDSGELSTNFKQRPTSVEIEVVKKVESLSYPYEFKGIPVPQFEKMPEQLVELKIDGPSPLRFEFVKINTQDLGGQKNQKALFIVTNHTNKQLTGFHLSMNYLDGSGKKLKDFPHAHSGGHDLPAAGETKDFEMSMPFAPEGVQKVSIDLRRVNFSDGTNWKLEKN